MSSRFGQQPAYDAVRWKFGSISKASVVLNLRYAHLLWSLAGRIVPSPDVRRRVSEALGTPVEECFTEEALSHEFNKRGRKPNLAVTE